MKNNFKKLSLWSFALAFAIFAFSYILYHYSTPAGWFTLVWQHTPGKPFMTMLFAIWGGIVSVQRCTKSFDCKYFLF